MPFFAEDMAHYWIQDCAAMSRTRCHNLSSFLATVGGTGMQDEVCGIGIVVLRETFETARERGDDRSDDDTEDDRRNLDLLTIADLWDSARYWMAKASDRF